MKDNTKMLTKMLIVGGVAIFLIALIVSIVLNQ